MDRPRRPPKLICSSVLSPFKVDRVLAGGIFVLKKAGSASRKLASLLDAVEKTRGVYSTPSSLLEAERVPRAPRYIKAPWTERGMNAGAFNKPIERPQDKNSLFSISAQRLDRAKRVD